jgi:hypothetical protein
MEEDQSIVFGTLNGRYDRHKKQKKGEEKITDKWEEEIKVGDTSYLYCAPACRSVSTARCTQKKCQRVHK